MYRHGWQHFEIELRKGAHDDPGIAADIHSTAGESLREGMNAERDDPRWIALNLRLAPGDDARPLEGGAIAHLAIVEPAFSPVETDVVMPKIGEFPGRIHLKSPAEQKPVQASGVPVFEPRSRFEQSPPWRKRVVLEIEPIPIDVATLPL